MSNFALDIKHRRTGYRRRTKEVRIKNEVADSIREIFPDIYGLPTKIEALVEFYQGRHLI